MTLPQISPGFKTTCDWTAVGVAAAAFVKHLPDVAALFSVIWLGLQIYGWFEKRGKLK